MKIIVKSEEELVNVATELVHVLNNLRFFTRKWEETYGVELRARKKYYEDKADELLKRLQVTEHRQSNQIKIEVNASTNTEKEG